MTELVANCPRCGSKRITFTVMDAIITGSSYNWQNHYEAFCLCHQCVKTTTFFLSESVHGDYKYVHKTGLTKIEGAINRYVNIDGFLSLKDVSRIDPPEFIPEELEGIFREGATCLAVECFNAAGTMFRLCLDVATRSMLPDEETAGLNSKTRRDLGLRLPWLIDNGLLPEGLRDLSTCVKDDGNDGAHAGNLTKEDAEDLLDFTKIFLERIYTEPERVKKAKERRNERRQKDA